MNETNYSLWLFYKSFEASFLVVWWFVRLPFNHKYRYFCCCWKLLGLKLSNIQPVGRRIDRKKRIFSLKYYSGFMSISFHFVATTNGKNPAKWNFSYLFVCERERERETKRVFSVMPYVYFHTAYAYGGAVRCYFIRRSLAWDAGKWDEGRDEYLHTLYTTCMHSFSVFSLPRLAFVDGWWCASATIPIVMSCSLLFVRLFFRRENKITKPIWYCWRVYESQPKTK